MKLRTLPAPPSKRLPTQRPRQGNRRAKSMKPALTRELAWAAAQDTANAHMRETGRVHWSIEDYNVAARTFNELYPITKDLVPHAYR